MADDGPETFKIEHVESAHFRNIYAAGAVFSGPIDQPKNYILTFYSEGARIISETLVPAEVPGTYKLGDPPVIDTQRLRRDEVSITISAFQLRGIVDALSKALKAIDQ
jgi:hypothetical protein